MATRMETRRALGGGAVAGLIGGAVLALYSLFTAFARGGDPWLVMKGAALPLLGERAAAHGFDAGAVLLGGIMHFAVAAFWGALFGLLFYGFSHAATLAFGVMWGFVVWIGMYFVALPLFGLAEVARNTPMPAAIISHVIFGVATALGFLPFQRETRVPRFRREVPT